MGCDSSCANLTIGLNPGCEALKRVGGINKRVWVGQISQLDGWTANADTLDFESFSMCNSATSPASPAVPYTLKKFTGKKFKNSKTHELQPGENINTWLQSIILVLFHRTSLEHSAVEALSIAEDLFVAYETNDGIIEVIGLETQGAASSDSPTGGLNATAGTGGSGILLNDPNSTAITLSGEHRIIARNFNVSEGATLAANIAYLNSLSGIE